MKEPLKHFLRLAQRGKYAAASGGEQRAYRLAKAVMEDIHGVDGLAIEGLLEFILVANSHPTEAELILEFGGPKPAAKKKAGGA